MTAPNISEGSVPREERPLMTIDEAADYLSIRKATLYTWRSRRTGYGPQAVKVGGCLRFRRSDLDSWIAAHTELPQDDTAENGSGRGKGPHPSAGVAMTRRSNHNGA